MVYLLNYPDEEWRQHCLNHRLYLPKGGSAYTIFRDNHTIYKIAIIPFIGWAMVHEIWWDKNKNQVCASVFIALSHRGKKLGRHIFDTLLSGYMGSTPMIKRSDWESYQESSKKNENA